MAAVALEANSLSPFVHKHSNLPSSFWYSNDFEENFMLSVSMCPLLFRYREKKCHFWVYKNNCSKHKHYRRLKWPTTLLFKIKLS